MRQPSIGRLIALLIGATVVLLLTIDTTMACRFWLRHRQCAPYPPVSCCAPAPVYSSTVVEGCCGSEISGVIESPNVIYEYETESHAPTPAVAPRVDNGAPSPMPSDVEPSVTGLNPADDVPVLDDLPEDELVEPAVGEEPVIVDEPDASPLDPVEDQPLEDDDLFDLDEAPADDTPVEDDLFSDPAEPMPSDDLDVLDTPADDAATDDLFSTPADDSANDLFEAPNDAAAPNGDLFDSPVDEVPPADDLFGTPADDAAQPADTFDDPGSSDLPGFDDPLPADEPADPVPSDTDGDSLDDLFGSSPAVSDPEPRTASAIEPADGLFDGLDAPASGIDAVPADELLDPPPADLDNTVDDLDDLFGGQPASTPQVTKTVAEQIEELPTRTWTDNTGRYQTVGRLVKVSPTHIRLLKDNGRYSTVPKHRLSEADLEYVREVTQQLGVDYFDQVALR